MQLRKLRQLYERLFKLPTLPPICVCEGLVWTACVVLRYRLRHTQRPISHDADTVGPG